MKYTTQTNINELKPCNVIIFPIFEDQKVESELKSFGMLDDRRKKIVDAIELEEFKGRKFERLVLHTEDAHHPRIMLVGLGKEKEYSVKKLRECVGAGFIHAQGKKWKKVSVVVTGALRKKETSEQIGSLLTRAVEISTYAYDEHKTDKEARTVPLDEVQFVGLVNATEKKAFEKGVSHGKIVAGGVNFTRHLGNTPPSTMTPEYLAHAAVEMTKKTKLKTKILNKAEIQKLGMGCLLGVAQGSEHEPKFIIVEYWGAAKSQKPIVLVGKGITFDSGGLSIKPANWMSEMKYDMLGGAAVLGAIKVASELKLKKNIVGLIPSAENMPSGTAFRPDDILVAMNGKTVEILNTDAEGRLILADALCYAKKYEPAEVIDLATLTGACMGALGSERSGLFTPDDKMCERLVEAGDGVGELLWRLPLGEEYSEAMKSEIADIKNLGGVGNPAFGGASTAAAFLQFFVDYKWAHIDLASAIFMGKAKPWLRPGANGFGVETLVSYLSR